VDLSNAATLPPANAAKGIHCHTRIHHRALGNLNWTGKKDEPLKVLGERA
jgi:hypothetical protein